MTTKKHLWRRDQVRYWATATAFSIMFGEVVGPLLAHHRLPILQHPAAFVVYYAALAGAFSLLVVRSVPLSLGVFFVYGVAAEWLLFGNVHGIMDVPGVLFFGLFYVFLFGTPVWIVRKLAARLPAGKAP